MYKDLEAMCPACSSNGKLKFKEKIEDKLFNELTFASRKRPELMHYDLFECENCFSLFTKRDVDLSNLLKNYEIAELYIIGCLCFKKFQDQNQ